MKRIICLICVFVLSVQLFIPAMQTEAAYTYETQLTFPAYGQETSTQEPVATLSGDGVQISFRKIKASDGKYYVQRQTTVDNQIVDDYTDGLGFLIMYASATTRYSWSGGGNENYPHFIGSYNNYSFNTGNVFEGGYPSWVTMSDISVSNGVVTMSGENSFATVSAVWSIGSAEKDPKVDLTVTVKQNGYYSFGMFTSPKGFEKDSMKFIQVPFRYNEKGLPDNSYLVSEAYSTSSVSQVTTNTGTKIANKDVTYGIFVDPRSIVSEGDDSAKDFRWVKNNKSYEYVSDTTKDQSNYGLSIRGKDGNVQPGAFAPIMGTADSQFSANGVYKITYRPMATVSEPKISSWYDNYERVLKDYLKVTDYRNNYYASMTDTIFNMTDLAMDDFYGGWSDEGKAHYNMEGRNVVSDADPLSYMQLYLLTEDEDILKERTIPSMEFILSRSSAIYNAYGRIDGTGTVHGYGSPAHMVNALLANSDTLSIGYTKMGFPAGKEGTDGIGNSSYFGAYNMTMGMMPYYQYLAAIRLNSTYVSKANLSGVNNPSEYLWQSRALALNKPDTDDETAAKQLSRAKTHGGWYVDRRVNLGYTDAQVANGANKAPNDQLFIFKDFTPNIHCLLELYEETKEQKYLDAAHESARRLIATLWSTYMPEQNENFVIDSTKADYINKFQKGNGSKQMWWHGDERFRLGEADDAWSASANTYISKWNDTAKAQEVTTVPAWTVSRVGLGIEQTTTFAYFSGNIIMSTWAPDLLRIAELTNDEMLETYARNALVGRFANYPSYYLTEYSTYQQQKDFPYIGPDTTQIYYHHIPVMISMLQDFLFSQAYAWSDKAVDFPSVRSQGYHYYSTRHYGFAPGKVYNEKDMWLWMKKGLVTVDNQQIDWFGTRKDGRAAFIFTNASDKEVTTTVKFGEDVNMGTRVNSIIYTPSGNTTKIIENKTTTVTIPPKTTVAVAFNTNVTAPAFSKMYGTNLTDYSDKFVASSVVNTNDVLGHVVQIAPDSYNAYVYSTYRPTSVDPDNGISRMIIRYSIGGAAWQAETDLTFPFEFSIPVSDSAKDFKYKVELYDKNSQKIGTSDTCTLAASYLEEEPEKIPSIKLATGTTRGTSISTTSNPTISGWNGNNNTSISTTGKCLAFFKVGNDTGESVTATAVFTLVDSKGALKRIAKVVTKTIPATNTSSSMLNFSTDTADPIVLTDADKGCHLVVYLWSGLDTMRPYIAGKYNFATGKVE